MPNILPRDDNRVPYQGAIAVGGALPYKLISAASTNATNVKASAGQIYGWALYNVNAAARYVKFYNTASTPNVGTDVPLLTVMVPGNTAGAGSNIVVGIGAPFSTGISFATTTGMPDSDTGGVGSNEVIVNLFYF